MKLLFTKEENLKHTEEWDRLRLCKKEVRTGIFRASVNESNKLVPEGVVGRVPYKGDLVESIHQFVGGIRSGMGYCGCKTYNDLKKMENLFKLLEQVYKKVTLTML